jgi:ribosomal protein S18 acetylase RimI-like enzyme
MLASFISVREGQPADASALASLFRESWMLAYSGIIPHAHLQAMIARRDTDWWRNCLRNRENVIIGQAGGKLAGYASFGPARIGGPFKGEIYELYLAPVFQGLGMGEHLFESARQRLDCQRLPGLIVWALCSNRAACDFYQRRGGKPIWKGSERFGRKTLAKLAFAWD